MAIRLIKQGKTSWENLVAGGKALEKKSVGGRPYAEVSRWFLGQED